VVKEIKFRVFDEVDINKNWMIDQHRLLEVRTRASRDVQIKFKIESGHSRCSISCFDTKDLSVADPSNCCLVN
jgi:hypothetical protein